ncbi:MAG: hypothetical protein WBX01_04760 [Nitrososphaeraceae archaeon]
MLTKLLAMAVLIVLTTTMFMVQSMTSTVYAIGACANAFVCAFASFGCAFAFAFGTSVTAGC